MFNQEYGSINLILNKFLSMSPIQWLSQPFEAFAACVLTNIWLGFPFIMIITLGGLQSIPKELYDEIKQKSIKINKIDTIESLKIRLQEIEHLIYSNTIMSILHKN